MTMGYRTDIPADQAPVIHTDRELLLDIQQRLVSLEHSRPTDRILTKDEAKGYTKHNSDSAFYRWLRRWGAKSCENRRYAKSQLDTALEREARKTRPQGR